MYLGAVKNKSAYEFLLLVDAGKAYIPNFNLPFYAIHGAKDEVALPKGTDFLFENAQTSTALKRKKIYENLYHELLHEKLPAREESATEITNYFNELYTSLQVEVSTANCAADRI